MGIEQPPSTGGKLFTVCIYASPGTGLVVDVKLFSATEEDSVSASFQSLDAHSVVGASCILRITTTNYEIYSRDVYASLAVVIISESQPDCYCGPARGTDTSCSFDII